MTNPGKTVTLNAVVRGRVQGIGFRYFVQRIAERAGLKGWVRNLPDGGVEIEVDGTRAEIELFVHQIKTAHPAAHVTALIENWGNSPAGYSGFEIR